MAGELHGLLDDLVHLGSGKRDAPCALHLVIEIVVDLVHRPALGVEVIPVAHLAVTPEDVPHRHGRLGGGRLCLLGVAQVVRHKEAQQAIDGGRVGVAVQRGILGR